MPDEALVEAVESIPDADPDSVAQYDDDTGHFVINSGEDDQDVDVIDEALSGSHPAGVAAAAIYLVDARVTQPEVSDAADVSPPTIRRWLDELETLEGGEAGAE